MLTRRMLLAAAPTLAFITTARSQSKNESETIEIIGNSDYPAFDTINPIDQFGSSEPAKEQKDRAQSIWNGAPTGPSPYDVANYFIDEYSATPDDISQWPNADAWNPLIVEFFRATSYKAENDLVPWCAAFVNWCLKRSNRVASGSAASQSFLDERSFKRTSNPKIGDLAVFTCYSLNDGRSVGLGHVAFVASLADAKSVVVAGGNQSFEGQSTICRRRYPIGPVNSRRTINGSNTPVSFRLNTYIEID